MLPLIYTLLVFASIYYAIRCPSCLSNLKVDVNYTLAVACFSLGLGISTLRCKQLLGTRLGLGNVAFSFCIGTFLWPALGLAASVMALQHGLPFAMVVGFAILAACPVGATNSSLHAHLAGGSLECSLLMSFIAAPFALITFPYAFRHFLLLLLDQPCPDPMSSPFTLIFSFFSNFLSSLSATSAAAAASSEEIRAQLTASLDVPYSVLTGIRNQALLGMWLPMAAGIALAATLPSQRLAAVLRIRGPQVAAVLIALTTATHTAGSAVAAGLAGGVTASARTDSGVVALEGQQQQQLPQLEGVDVMLIVAALVVVVIVVGALHWVALLLGWLIPAGVGLPGWTCRTTAYQASMRNPLPGLALATALFGSSAAFPLVAAPCVASLTLQAAVGAWTAFLGWLRPPRQPKGPAAAGNVATGAGAGSPRASMVNSQSNILRQQTIRRNIVKHD